MSDHKLLTCSRTAFWAWFTVAVFFFYQYILRVSPGVMIYELRHEFNLSAEMFSQFGSYYLYGYSLMQVPLGLIVDRVGVRKTIVASILLCIGGTYLMGSTEELWVALFSRVLVGVGSATAFMCSLKIVADRFPLGQRGFLMGATLTFGTIGALVAGKPLVYMLDNFGWRQSMTYSAALGVPILILALFLLPKRAEGRQSFKGVDFGVLFSDIMSVVKNGRVMLYAFLAIGLYTPLSVLADLWGTGFLMEKFSLVRSDAAGTSMMMYVGLALGCLTLPGLCEKYGILNHGIRYSCILLFALFGVLLYGPSIEQYTLMALLLALGIFCGGEMMCFTGALSYSNPDNSGITIGVVNTLNMLGGAILQWAIGYGLDLQWDGALDEYGVRIYDSAQYVRSLTILLVVVGLCVIASFFLRAKKS